MKLVSWNVNGMKSILGRGFLDFVGHAGADFICLQETKSDPAGLGVEWPSGYHRVWNPAQRKGYSGVAIWARERPLATCLEVGLPVGDREGRVIALEYDKYHVVTVYTPNSQRELARLAFRVNRWDVAFRRFVRRLAKEKPVVFCGDFNVAHEPIDLANPSSNRRNAGFTDEERESFGKLLKAGFVDSFREFEKGPGHYSWWSYRMNARARNIGWRLDYVCVSKELRGALQSAFILPEVMGSDHCPVGVEIDI